MCYYTAQNVPLAKVEKRFQAKADQPESFLQSDFIVGFEYLNIPVILDTSPAIISTNYHWGLVPSWSKDIDFRKNTLNARIETMDEKASFKNVTANRCLVIASSFYEWHWNDEKGSRKTSTKSIPPKTNCSPWQVSTTLGKILKPMKVTIPFPS
jgi:putative SOS response-associated peptidase YedK